MSDTGGPYLSIVVPLKDEGHNIEILTEKILASCQSIGQDFEILYIEDGSSDDTYEKICQAQARDNHIRIIRLRKNFGKAVALDLGFRSAKGKYIFSMDGDLQDDPTEFTKFIQKLETGYDLVSGWKRSRQDNLLNRWFSKFFNFMIRLCFNIQIHDINCGFKLYRRDCIQPIRIYGELYRFIPVIADSLGFKIGEVEVVHHPRAQGKSKYGYYKFLHGLLDFFTILYLVRFNKRPMHFFGMVGLLIFAIGFLICGYFLLIKLGGGYIGHRPLFSLGILTLIIGTIFFAIALLGETMLHEATLQKDFLEAKYNAIIERLDQ